MSKIYITHQGSGFTRTLMYIWSNNWHIPKRALTALLKIIKMKDLIR